MTAALPQYSEHRDPGLVSFGPIPEHWKVKRLRYLAEMRVSNIDKHSRDGESSVRLCNYVDVYKNDRITENLKFMKATASENDIARFHLERGDVLITKDSELWTDIGVPALVEYTAEDLVSGYHLALLRPKRELIDGSYLFRALQSSTISYQFHIKATGVTRYGLSHEAIKSIFIPIPPLVEQATITRFLDAIDIKIHRFIRNRRRLIAILNEQKQAVIDKLVTRGLEPSTHFESTGVVWLPDIPIGWQILPLKRWVSAKITDGPHETPTLIESGVSFLSAESMVNGRFDFSRRRGFISRDLHEVYIQKCHPQRDDIFMCKSGSTTGKVAMVETDDEFSVWSPLALIRVNSEKVLPQLMYFVLQSLYVQKQIRSTWSFGTQPNLSMGAMERIQIALPPMGEQPAILAHLEAQLSRIEDVVEQAIREIDLIREYRTRLITDVVTGKVDVQHLASQLGETDVSDLDTMMADDEFEEGSLEDAAEEAASQEEGVYADD